MTEYFQKNLFYNISLDEYKQLLTCLHAREKYFSPGETICTYDTSFREIGIIGKGTVLVVRYEINGARTILERLGPQDLFGQILSYPSHPMNDVCVVCDTDCHVLFLDYEGITCPCGNACARHHQLIRNLLSLISEKALSLSQRVEVLSQRTIREKLICFFLQLAGQKHSSAFTLPFTMVDLADYLSIDRSAMTRELKRMKEEGLLKIDRKNVQLYLEGV